MFVGSSLLDFGGCLVVCFGFLFIETWCWVGLIVVCCVIVICLWRLFLLTVFYLMLVNVFIVCCGVRCWWF